LRDKDGLKDQEVIETTVAILRNRVKQSLDFLQFQDKKSLKQRLDYRGKKKKIETMDRIPSISR